MICGSATTYSDTQINDLHPQITTYVRIGTCVLSVMPSTTE